jgi:hypothetical protein
MQKSEIYNTILEIAKNHFFDELVDIGVSGSLFFNDDSNDIDTIIIIRHIKIDLAAEFKQLAEAELQKKVSIKLVTPMMLDTNFFDSKTAVMLYKGVNFLMGTKKSLSFEEMRKICLPQIHNDIQGIIKYLIEGRSNKDKAIDLLTQFLVICQ